MLMQHLCAFRSIVVVSTKSIYGIVWNTSRTSHCSFLLERMTEAWWGCLADRDQMLVGLVATLISLGDLTSACLFQLFILSCSRKHSPSLLLALSKAHTSFTRSVLPLIIPATRRCGDSSEGCCDPRVRTEKEDGPDSRPFPSGNLAIPALFEACWKSPPCPHPSGPRSAHSHCSWVRYCSLPKAGQPHYTQHSWGKPAKWPSPLESHSQTVLWVSWLLVWLLSSIVP